MDFKKILFSFFFVSCLCVGMVAAQSSAELRKQREKN